MKKPDIKYESWKMKLIISHGWRSLKSNIRYFRRKCWKFIQDHIRPYFRRHPITRILTVVFSLLFVVNGIHGFWRLQEVKHLTGDIEVGDYEVYMESLKEAPSDINGMSQYDKYKMGLDYHDGSDSDHDGLTDKEEIEVYGTDPLKSSTMDDLYSDGYKVRNKMDPKTKYDYAQDRTFDHNGCPEITLEAKSTNDFKAAIKDCTGSYELDNWGIDKVYKGYFISNFGGSFTIDVGSILAENEVELSELSVYVYDGVFLVHGRSKMEKCDFSENGNLLTVEYDFDDSHNYYVFVTKKKSLINSLINVNKTDVIPTKKAANFKYLMTHSWSKEKILYPDMDDASEKAFFDYVTANITHVDDVTFEKKSEFEIQMMYKAYSTALAYCEVDFSNTNVNSLGEFISYIPRIFFSYQLCDYDGAASIDAGVNGKTEDGKPRAKFNNYHTKFDPYVDELPFRNFGSKYTKGNCAGMAYLTTYLANNGSFPATGAYEDISWDLTSDPANKTLTDPGLADYKDKKFIDRKGKKNILDNGLTVGEKQFVDMIGACWKRTNDAHDLNKYRMNNKDRLSWETEEAMMKQLDAGRVITVSLLMYDGTGHEIVLYDYYWVDDEHVNFRAYDPNIPQNRQDGFTFTCGEAVYFLTSKIDNGDGTYSMGYFYWPIEESFEYCASNYISTMPESAIIVSDETLQIYNK